MTDKRKFRPAPPSPAAPAAPAAQPGQRRASRVVHDERGNARVEWIQESAEKLLDRLPLELVDDAHDSRGTPVWNPQKVEKGWNPYQSVGKPYSATAEPPPPSSGKKDLRKLSEWIKLQRELEARKRRGED